MLDLMKKNITLNNLKPVVNALQLDWYACFGKFDHSLPQLSTRGAELPIEIVQNPPQLVLAADCVYFEPAFPLLVQTLRDLTENSAPEILFCYKKRRKVRDSVPSSLLIQ